MIIFEINLWLNDLDSKFTILNYLFSAVKFTKIANPDKYSYSEYVIRFDVHRTYSRSDKSDFSENIKILKVNNSSSQHACNRTKDILILVKSPTDGFNGTAITAEAGYSIHFSEQQNKFCLQWKQQLFICQWSKNLSI